MGLDHYDRAAAIQDAHIGDAGRPDFGTSAENGGDGHQGFKKVTIPCSSAIVPGIVEGAIGRTGDPDSGYQVAVAIPGMDDIEILPPGRLYARQGRSGEHDAMVARLKRERNESLTSSPASTSPSSSRSADPPNGGPKGVPRGSGGKGFLPEAGGSGGVVPPG